ncbi:MAG: VWA domain-containing protein [Acidimicrobiia bacterium]|nr:VWA domain-containing protein [Acidimicrobiia bacterium]
MFVRSLTRRVLPALLALVGLVAFAVPDLTADAQSTKTFYLTVVDSSGQPVTDLRPDEIAVGELAEGAAAPVQREVVSFRKAPTPASIVLLADTSKATGGGSMGQRGQVQGSGLIQDVRKAFSVFVKAMSASNPDTEMELMEFGQAAILLTRMTSSAPDLEKGINRLFPKDNQPAVLLEAITEGARTLQKAKHPRRAIVAFQVLPTDDRSVMQPQQMLTQVINAQASFWIVVYSSGTVTADARGVVTNALARQTGGRSETIAAESALELHLTNMATAIANQYEVQYTRPAGETPKQLVMSIGRQGLSLHHTIYPPK